MKNREAAVDLALLSIRLVLGAIFIAHGAQKLFGVWGGIGMEGFAKFLASLNVPAPTFMAYVTAIAEFGGGILVLIGLFSRPAALGLVGVMVVAILKVHLKDGFFQPGCEYALALLAMSLAILLAGPGGLSVEGFLRKKRGGMGVGP